MRFNTFLAITGLCLCVLTLLACTFPIKRKILITAHRGASGLAPENTIAAMRKAIEFHADFAELDVQETKDGHIILLHDADLRRTTNDSGLIWEKTLADLKGVDAGAWKASDFIGEPIPLLTTVIDSVNRKMKLNIEIKINGHQQDIERRIVEIIEKKNFIDQCIVTSFNRSSVDKVKDLNPEIKVGLIFSKMPQEDVYQTRWELLSVHYSLVDRVFIEKAHKADKQVHVWTVDDPDMMKKLIADGVDNIITNRPDILYEVLQTL